MKNNATFPDVGALLKARIREKGFTDISVASKLGLVTSTVNSYYSKRSLQARSLWHIGEVIGHNFFAELGEMQKIPFVHKGLEQSINELKVKVQEQQEKITDLEKELAIYKRIVERNNN